LNKMFENSLIIQNVKKVFLVFCSLYNDSKTNQLLISFDLFLKNSAKNSSIFNFIIRKNNNFISESFLYKFTLKCFSLINKINLYLKKIIINSQFVITAKDLIVDISNKPFNILGIFGLGLFGSNIIFGVLFSNTTMPYLMLKILGFAFFLLISTFKITIKKILSTSVFYNFFKWTISYKN